MSDMVSKLKDVFFYVVVNSDGQFYRRKGYGGYGKSWVDDILTARIYVKLDMARRQASYFANAYPDYPPPKLLKLGVSAIELMDEADRIAKARAKKKRRLETQEYRRQKQKLKDAQVAFDAAKERLAKLTGG